MSEYDESRMIPPSDGGENQDAGQPLVVDLSGIATGPEEREDLSKFQRIAAGFFAQTREPALTINVNKVAVNAAATRLFPEVDYMEILINKDERKVAFKPCDELNISGYRWAKSKDGKRYATQRTGLPFVLCVCQIMGWDPNNRYRILGKKILSETDEEILVFDLRAGQGFEKSAADEKGKKSRSTILTGWDGNFGPAYNGESGSLHVGTFDGYTYFSIKDGQLRDANPQATDTAGSGEDAREGDE